MLMEIEIKQIFTHYDYNANKKFKNLKIFTHLASYLGAASSLPADLSDWKRTGETSGQDDQTGCGDLPKNPECKQNKNVEDLFVIIVWTLIS